MPNQHGELIEQKTFSKILSALPTYEVERLFACSPSVADRDLSISHSPEIELLTLKQQIALIAAQDVVIGAQR